MYHRSIYEDDLVFLKTEELELGFEEEAEGYTGISCVTPGNPYILHCFPAHETALTKEHREHLDRIVEKIRRSFRRSRPIRRVKIVGHAATWRGISRTEYGRRAILRAAHAETQLILRLNAAGLGTKVSTDTTHRYDDEPRPGRSNLTHRSDRIARNNRALNRRVEIFLFTGPKPKEKKPPCKIGELIRKAPVASIAANPAEQRRLECLRQLLAQGVCGSRIDDRYWVFLIETFRGQQRPCTMVGLDAPQGVVKLIKPRRAITQFKKRIESSKSPKAIAREIKKLHDDILCQINALRFFITTMAGDMPKSALRETRECIDARMLMAQSTKTRPVSIYKCFSRLLKGFFDETCRLP